MKKVSLEVGVIIVNYRTPALTVECLASLSRERDRGTPTFSVIVVDSASGDDSAHIIQEAIISEGWSEWVTLLPLEHNRGFSAGNNAAITTFLGKSPSPPYIHLLNPDTLVREGAVKALYAFIRDRPEVGVVGSRIVYPDGSPQGSARRDPTPLSEFERGAASGPITRLLSRWAVSLPDHPEPFPCDWVSGTSMLVRREVLEQLQGLDEGFFLYFEETDFCLRARKAGWSVWVVPESEIAHYEGVSTGHKRTENARQPSYMYASRRRYFRKHYGVTGLLAADACWLMGRAVLRMRCTVGLGPKGVRLSRYDEWDLIKGDIQAIALRHRT